MKDFIVLGIDTSGEYCSAALVDGGKTLGEISERAPQEHSSKLIPFIDRVLKKNKLKIRDIKAVAVSIGPGCYTGLRVGVASAKALAQTLGVPIVGIPTLDAIALNAVSSPPCAKAGRGLAPILIGADVQYPVSSNNQICAITDARKQQVYAAIYKTVASGQWPVASLKKKTKDMVLGIDDLLNQLTTSDVRRPTVFIGNAIPIYRDAIKEKLGDKAIFSPEELWRPKAGLIALEGYRKLQKNRKGDDLFKLKPVYIREPDIHQSN